MNIASKTQTWPISKCRGEWLTEWEFVKEHFSDYWEALAEAGRLQKEDPDPAWQYRVWDCR